MAQKSLTGERILGYKVEEKLGNGAFGTVYKVTKSNASGTYVRALKHITIPTEKHYSSVLNSMGGDTLKADSYFSEMLNHIVSEIRILNNLSEKGAAHIVRYYENDIRVTESPLQYNVFILMEYLTPLEEYIKSHDNFSVRDVVKLGLDILDGLGFCHNNRIIHRDIKDDNIFVSDTGEYKIGDFGVSKILEDSSKANSLKGTPNFLAPEVYLGKESYTKSVDLYSLGVVLYRLLNYNRNPFLPHFPEQYFSNDEDRAFERRMSGELPDLPSLGGEEIGNVILKAISSSKDRFQTAKEFSDTLKEAADHTPEKVLAESIKFSVFLHTMNQTDMQSEEYRMTFESQEEDTPFGSMAKAPAKKHGASVNRRLFESIGEVSSADQEREEGKQEEIPNREGWMSDAFDKEEKTAEEKLKKKKRKHIAAVCASVFAIVAGAILYFNMWHIWDNGKILDEADCEKEGHIKYTCTICGKTKEETIPIEHMFTEYIYNGDATAQEKGTRTAVCGYGCGISDTIEAEWEMRFYSYQINEDDTITITGWYGSESIVKIPEVIEGKKVSEIGDYAFGYSESLTEITIPEGVTSIADNAFFQCESLAKISIPDSLTSIGDYAFCFCFSLAEITIPDSVISIGKNPFCFCVSLEIVNISSEHSHFAVVEGVLFDKVDKSLIYYPAYLTDKSYEVPQGIEKIGNNAFCYCESLREIIIPESVISIGNYAFRN